MNWTPTRWYRILQPDGSLWMETSDPEEAREESARTGWPVERMYEHVGQQWRIEEVQP
ncbi:hypothetical protein [Nocardia grenadensis]|uniref:hypothetical protein n=1 Tax=Nocardia grenadensis TaxID=931537 RepID=UPI000A7B29C3|nr:hypothetical protein [Nocardia grenadensis]